MTPSVFWSNWEYESVLEECLEPKLFCVWLFPGLFPGLEKQCPYFIFAICVK